MVLSFERKGSLVMLWICAGVHNLIALMNPLVDYSGFRIYYFYYKCVLILYGTMAIILSV